MSKIQTKSTLKIELLAGIGLSILYILLIILFSNPNQEDDQKRYIWYAENLTQGFYSPSDNPELLCGPGYSLVLAPFVALGIPLMVPNLLNALFLMLGLMAFYRMCRYFMSRKGALIATGFLAIYPPLIRWSVLLYSESLAFMFACGLGYFMSRLLLSDRFSWWDIGLGALSLGFLALTKYVFFQVMVVAILIMAAAYVRTKKMVWFKSGLVCIGGLLVFSPYLMYTYSLTGKFPYTGTIGGQVLYFRTTPYEGEHGNWFSDDVVLQKYQLEDHKDLHLLSKNHRAFFESIEGMSFLERDSAFKAQAMANLKEHPEAYVMNTITNLGRLFFHIPFSYRLQRLETYGYLIPNGFLLVLTFLCLIPAFRARKRLPYSLIIMLMILLIYLGGISLLGGRGRQLLCIIPLWFFFLAYVIDQLIKIRINITSIEPPQS